MQEALSTENRQGRRRLQRTIGKRRGKVVKLKDGEMPDHGAPFDQRPCGHCREAGRGFVPMGLHPQPDYFPCPDAVLTVGGERYGLLGVKPRPFRRPTEPTTSDWIHPIAVVG